MFGCRYGCQCVELVVHAANRPLHFGHGLASLQDLKLRGFASGHKVADGAAKCANLAPAALTQHAGQAFLQAIDDHTARAGHGANQVVELALDRGQIVKNVGVVKLEVVEDGSARAVMHEFAALVEEGCVVFVGFDHKVLPSTQSG